MDQVSDIAYRADGKRLGDEILHSDFGEFRHYIAEKYAYNMAYRFAGKETTDVSLSWEEEKNVSKVWMLIFYTCVSWVVFYVPVAILCLGCNSF